MVRVLFVCLGNICRSPAGEGIFISMIKEAGLDKLVEVDSAGTSANHTGEPADARMQAHAKERGYVLPSLARQFNHNKDFTRFNYILTMDDSNYSDVIDLAPNQEAKNRVFPMTSFCKVHQATRVPDPYYDGDDGFRYVLDLLEDSCSQLVERIKLDLKDQGKI